MPEILHRCVEEVMSKGHDQQSAYAICRTSLGLLSDGSQDNTNPDVTEAQMRSRVQMELSFRAGPVVLKRMMIARPIGKYVNGPEQKGTISKARLSTLVENQKKYPRNIPIYLLGDHPETNDERPADGYVEAVSMDSDGNLWADPAKLTGRAAEWVAQDRIRGASIYTKFPKDYDGEPLGECLWHVLLSDEAFMRDINVAASRSGGAESPGIGFTAFKKEAPVADNKDEGLPKKTEIEDAKALRLITHYEDQNVKLRSENLVLTERVETLNKQLNSTPPDEEKEKLAMRVADLERKTEAQEIRELVMRGFKRGTLKAAWCKDYDQGGDLGTINWFKSSPRFNGDMKLLRYQVEQSEPVVALNQRFSSGSPSEGAPGKAALSQEDKDWLRSKNIDPDKSIAAKGVRDLTDYRRRVAEGKGN